MHVEKLAILQENARPRRVKIVPGIQHTGRKEVEAGESKALVTAVDACVNWNEHESEDATSSSPQQISCVASCDADFAFMGISPQVSTCVYDCDSIYQTLKEAYDDMKPKYNTSFIEAQAYK